MIQQLGDNHLQKYANHENKPLDHGYKIGIGVLGQLTTSIRLAGRMPIKLIINILYTYYDTTIKAVSIKVKKWTMPHMDPR